MADKNNFTPENFVKEYSPIAERIGEQIDVDPAILLAKFGLETSWGKSVVPKSYNLGNIKDFSGSGITAVDNETKKPDKYVQFEDPEVFADYYVDLIKRLYPNAIGSKSDMNKFALGLVGPKGSYNENPKKYAETLNKVYGTVLPFMPTKIEDAAPSETNEKNPFDTGETEAERIKKEPPPSKGNGVQTYHESDIEDASLIGGTAGAIKGAAEKGLITPKKPVHPNLEAAQERFKLEKDKLFEAQKNSKYASVEELEKQFSARKDALSQAAEELKIAEAEAKALNKVPKAGSLSINLEEGAPGRASGPKVVGDSGAKNWIKQAAGQYHQVPEEIQNRATDMTKTSETGAKKLIEQDLKNLKKIEQIGGGNMQLTEAKPGQLMVPSDIANERNAAFERELAEKQAKDAAQSRQLAQAQEQQRLAAEARAKNARAAHKTAGNAVGTVADALKRSRADEKTVTDLQSNVNVFQKSADRLAAKEPSFMQQIGYKAAKSPIIANTLGGLGTGLSIEEAIHRYNTGDTSGAVLATIEAALGAMSMTPPIGPAAMAVKGIGTVGGLGMIPISIAHDYFRKRGAWAGEGQE
jgi:hypothetical protein